MSPSKQIFSVLPTSQSIVTGSFLKEFVRGLSIGGPSGSLTSWRAGCLHLEDSSVSLSYPRPDLAQMRPFKPMPYSSMEYSCAPPAIISVSVV